MLVLSRKRDEAALLTVGTEGLAPGTQIRLLIVDIRGDKVRLGINAPRDIYVDRITPDPPDLAQRIRLTPQSPDTTPPKSGDDSRPSPVADATSKPAEASDRPDPAGATGGDTSSRVIAIVAKNFQVDPGQLGRDSHFAADLNADSLDAVEIVMDLEDAFGVTISDERWDGCDTIGQAIELITELRGEIS